MSRLERSNRSLKAMSRAGALAAAAAAAILAGAATFTTALAEEADADLRYEAPIGHRQPRVQDLPSGIVQEEKRTQAEEDALDKKLETSICRGC